MFDAAARKLIDPPLDALGRSLARSGVTANQITLAGLGAGVLAALSIALGQPLLGLGFIALSRLADGLDGAVARATTRTDFGGYLDILCDFAFYALIPLAFVFYDPAQNALAGASLIAAFYVNGASFLGYALLAEKHGMETRAQGIKSLYYSNGLLEGSETIAFFALLCLMPGGFAPLAWGFGALCLLTTGMRAYGAYRLFSAQ